MLLRYRSPSLLRSFARLLRFGGSQPHDERAEGAARDTANDHGPDVLRAGTRRRDALRHRDSPRRGDHWPAARRAAATTGLSPADHATSQKLPSGSAK
jgi:hypothetical protein